MCSCPLSRETLSYITITYKSIYIYRLILNRPVIRWQMVYIPAFQLWLGMSIVIIFIRIKSKKLDYKRCTKLLCYETSGLYALLLKTFTVIFLMKHRSGIMIIFSCSTSYVEFQKKKREKSIIVVLESIIHEKVGISSKISCRVFKEFDSFNLDFFPLNFKSFQCDLFTTTVYLIISRIIINSSTNSEQNNAPCKHTVRGN